MHPTLCCKAPKIYREYPSLPPPYPTFTPYNSPHPEIDPPRIILVPHPNQGSSESSDMVRPAASRENKSFAPKFAMAVTSSTPVLNDMVARSGPFSLYSCLCECCPSAVRLHSGGVKDGLSETEFNKALQAAGFERERDRRGKALNKMDDPLGAGMYLFSYRRWKNPSDPSDRAALEEAYDELYSQFPSNMQHCSLERFLQIVSTFCDVWTPNAGRAKKRPRSSWKLSGPDLSPLNHGIDVSSPGSCGSPCVLSPSNKMQEQSGCKDDSGSEEGTIDCFRRTTSSETRGQKLMEADSEHVRLPSVASLVLNSNPSSPLASSECSSPLMKLLQGRDPILLHNQINLELLSIYGCGGGLSSPVGAASSSFNAVNLHCGLGGSSTLSLNQTPLSLQTLAGVLAQQKLQSGIQPYEPHSLPNGLILPLPRLNLLSGQEH
eukprot:288605-Hanusia_phi.AAC.2